MLISGIKAVRKQLRFKFSAGTSRGVYHTRDLWLLIMRCVENNQAYFGVGECAPLYDLSIDYTPDYEEVLSNWCLETIRLGRIPRKRLQKYPSILTGLETAYLSALGAKNKGDCSMLFDTPFSRSEAPILINGLIWMGNQAQMEERIEEKLKKGFGCIKLKIGALNFEDELSLLKKIRARYSSADIEIRVDANGSFSPDDAPCKLEQLSKYEIHSIEQPLKAGQWEETARLAASSPLPIALDEELIGCCSSSRKEELLSAIRPSFLVLKPTLHGGFSGCEEWIALAKARNIDYWVTSALESNVGLNAIAQWFSSLPVKSGVRWQGLGTGQLFVQNTAPLPLCLEGDRLWFGDEKARRRRLDYLQFMQEWNDASDYVLLNTSGSTGVPKKIFAPKEKLKTSAIKTCDFLHLKSGETALCCLPFQYIAGKMMAVRSQIRQLSLWLRTPSSRPLQGLRAAPDFAAMTPLQAAVSLQDPREQRILRQIKCLIIGGGAIHPDLEKRLRAFPHAVWSTYGMTETYSHIALRRINGPDASDSYKPLPGVSVTTDERGCLEITAPDILSAPLLTNDLATILPDGSFLISGRIDNVVCSGGLKFHLEELERCVSLPFRFQFTAAPDERLGEALVLLADDSSGNYSDEQIMQLLGKQLVKLKMPKFIVRMRSLPKTATGKPARSESRNFVKRCFEDKTTQTAR